MTKTIPPLKPFVMAYETRVLIDHLRTLEKGEMRTYAQLDMLIGSELREGKWHCLTSAREALSDEGIVIAVQRGIGVFRPLDGQAVEITAGFVRGAGRKAGRASSVANAVDEGELSEPEKKRFRNSRAAAGVVHSLTKSKAMSVLGKALDTITTTSPAEMGRLLITALMKPKD